MTKKRIVRKNAAVLPWLRAAAFAAVAFVAAQSSAFYPEVARPGFAFAAGLLSLLAPPLGVLAVLVEVGLPLLAGDFVVGAVFLVLSLASLQYLSQDDASVFLLIAASFLAAAAGAPWAAVIIGGYVLGSAEGAAAGAIACLALEVAGVLTGSGATGVIATGGSQASMVVDLGKPTADALAFAWVPKALAAADPGAVVGKLSKATPMTFLGAQPLLWGAAAALAGSLKRAAEDRLRLPFALAVAVGAPLLLAVATFAAGQALGADLSLGAALLAGALSSAAATVALGAWETGFAPSVIEQRGALSDLRTDDADVDDLLRMIASAEDALANRHTSECVVMITDMKSFSKMTEEQGSVLTAKMIQRHRDLLLPIVHKHGGNGKSTGGDGLLAAFGTCDEALAAARDMQLALQEFNASGRAETEMLVRVGIASGEVVLDKGGKPFIGDALNLAARVMGLADGGQVFVTDSVVADARGQHRTATLGQYELKNISRPVVVHELLWRDGQQPQAPAALEKTG